MSNKQAVNILLIGENNCNNYVCEYFSQKGFSVACITDVFSIRTFSGEIGNFTVNTNDSELKADFVLITEHPSAVYEIKQGDSSGKGPVVFLLDYNHESPPAASIYALENAVQLARKKKKVYYLAKYIRTAGQGVEDLYKEARKSGVVFYKYSDLQIDFCPDDDEYTLKMNGLFPDDEPKLSIQTKNIFIDNSMDVSERFLNIAAKLNLNTNKQGFLTEDRYFLAPVLTSRRGVYHLTRDLAAERLTEGLDTILVNMQLYMDDENTNAIINTATVDGNKCIFCYNCYRSCTHAALEPDLKENQMQCLSNACEGCGICLGICPANAITLGEAGGQVQCFTSSGAQGDGSLVFSPLSSELSGFIPKNTREPSPCAPMSPSDSRKTLMIYCENSGGWNMKEQNKLDDVCVLDVIPVPCGGSIDVKYLSSGLLEYDKVLSVVCHDDSCRHFNGSKRACVQTEHLQRLLDASGIKTKKAGIIKASIATYKMHYEIMAFAEASSL
ncbi:MAG: hydrogenase iron-sulfur subunit [Oscillospiraceae bacterium]|nr:hydrogenase iron-sulfur subunit [Oscillospiraceae bacterium]